MQSRLWCQEIDAASKIAWVLELCLRMMTRQLLALPKDAR